jgi:sodium transport system permease protein
LVLNWKDVKVLYLREIRSALRDRMIVTNSVLLPIFLYPVLIWLVYTGFTFISGQNEELKSRIMLKNLPAAHANLKRSFEADKSVILSQSADPVEDIRLRRLDAAVEFLPARAGDEIPGNFETHITYDESRDQSERAKTRIEQKVSKYREEFLQQQAAKLGISRIQLQDFRVDDKNVSTNRQVGVFMIALPIFFIIMLAVGAMHPAIDSTAGERENSTWETMMTVASSRASILIAKYLYVATMSFTAAFLNLFAMMMSMGTLLAPMIETGRGKSSLRIPLESAPVILLGAALLALFVSAGMMILASFARNYKEGQSMVGPFYVALIIPIMFLQTPGLAFTPRIALIPVANVMMMMREAIQGIYHWRLIGMTLAVETACVIAALRLAILIVQHEDFLMGSYSGSFGKFAKERLLGR